MVQTIKSLQEDLLSLYTYKLTHDNTYQKILIALNCLIWFELNYLCQIGSFVFMNPLIECSGQQTTQKLACQIMTQCTITNSYTATFYAGLYCDKKSDRQLVQSAYSFGTLLGMLIIPTLSDKIGRKIPMIGVVLGMTIGTFLMIIGIFKINTFLMIFSHIIIGICVAGAVVLTYVISAEFFSDRTRQYSIIMYNGMWGLSLASFCAIYYLIPEWFNFLILLALIPLIGITFLTYMFVIESPLYLLLNKKNHQAFQQSIRQLSVFNNPNQESLQNSIRQAKQILISYEKLVNSTEKKAFTQILSELFTNKKTIKAFILIFFLYSGYNCEYFGSQYCLQRTGFSFGVTLLLVGCFQFATNTVCGYFIHKIPRKKGLYITICLGTFLGMLFLFPFVSNSTTIQTLIVPFYRITTIASFVFVLMLQTQSFDATVRSTAIGLMSSLAKVCNILIPFLVTWMNDSGVHPLVATTGLYFILSLLPNFFVEQTLKMCHSDDNLAESNKTQNVYKLRDSINTDLLQQQ